MIPPTVNKLLKNKQIATCLFHWNHIIQHQYLFISPHMNRTIRMELRTTEWYVPFTLCFQDLAIPLCWLTATENDLRFKLCAPFITHQTFIYHVLITALSFRDRKEGLHQNQASCNLDHINLTPWSVGPSGFGLVRRPNYV